MDWRKVYFPCRRVLMDWLEATQAEVVASKGWFLVIMPGPYSELFKKNSFHLDSFFKSVVPIKKYTRSTRRVEVALAEVPGISQRLFVKKVMGCRAQYAFHHLFRYARSLQGAIAADRLERAGIDTPRTLFVGERRRFVALEAEGLVTAEKRGKDLLTLLGEGKIQKKQFKRLLEDVARLVARMHSVGVVHTDLDLKNIYLPCEGQGGSYGVWDLLDARVFSGKIPGKTVDRDFIGGVRTLCQANEKIGGKIPVEEIYQAFAEKYVQGFKAFTRRGSAYVSPLQNVLREL